MLTFASIVDCRGGRAKGRPPPPNMLPPAGCGPAKAAPALLSISAGMVIGTLLFFTCPPPGCPCICGTHTRDVSHDGTSIEGCQNES